MFYSPVSSSTMRISSLSRIPRASAMRQRVSTLAFFVPASIMARWLRATPARPDSTSWDRACRMRRSRMIRPVISQLYGIMFFLPFADSRRCASIKGRVFFANLAKGRRNEKTGFRMDFFPVLWLTNTLFGDKVTNGIPRKKEKFRHAVRLFRRCAPGVCDHPARHPLSLDQLPGQRGFFLSGELHVRRLQLL